MATKTEIDLPKLFSQLQVAGEDEDYEWGLDISEKILKVFPDDQDAISCRIVSLIQLSEYEDALKAINRASKSVGKEVYAYEKAYCQYKSEKYLQGLQTLSDLPVERQSSVAVLDLTAQIQYRLEQYEKSAQSFQRARGVKDSQERSANMVAALSYCSYDTVAVLLSDSPIEEDSMELCFNLATTYLNTCSTNTGRLDKAVALLRKAEGFCEEMIADDEDNEPEMIPIQIQLGHALHCQGQFEAALKAYGSLLKQKPSSVVHTMTAANNVIVLNRDKDIFDSKKKIKLISNEQGLKKLNSRQQSVVLFNRCLFALQINQLEQCRQLLQDFKKSFPKAEEVILIESALLNREKKSLECCTLMEKCLETTPLCSVLVYLTLAQFYMGQGNHAKVCEVLEKVPELPKYLGIVSVLVSQYTFAGEEDSCKRLLEKVLGFWKGRQDIGSSDKEKVLRTIGQYKLQRGFPEEAADIFEYLFNSDKSNVGYLASLISAYSRYNPQKAEELGSQLSQSYPTSSAVDVNALEQMPSFRHTRRQVAKSEVAKKAVNTATGLTTTKEKKKKKKGKPKLPKNYDPLKPPDPERWMPLRERSYYRKSKKKGQQTGIGRGTQGLSAASAAMAAKLDASKPNPSDTKDITASSKPKHVSQQHKKKKKGKR